MFTSVILFVLIIMWVAVLVPPYWKNRSSRGGRSLSIGSFKSSSNQPTGLQALSSIQSGSRHAVPTQNATVVPFRRPGDDAGQSITQTMQPYGSASPNFASPATARGAAPQMTDADLMFGGPNRGMNLQAPMSLDDARRRRRNVLVGAFTISLVLLGAAIQWSGIFTLLFLVSLAVSLGFVMVVVQNQRTADLQAATVAPLHPVGYQPQPLSVASPGYMQHRSAN